MPVTPFLIIGATTVPVARGQATLKFIVRGKSERAMDNTLRSTIDPNAKREWAVTTIPWTPAAVAAFMAAVPHGSRQNVTGRMVGGGAASPPAPVVCVVEYGDQSFHGRVPTDVARVVSLTVREV